MSVLLHRCSNFELDLRIRIRLRCEHGQNAMERPRKQRCNSMSLRLSIDRHCHLPALPSEVMVETDDFLQNFDVLKSEIYKPGRLLSVQRCDEAPTAECSIVDPNFASDSRTQVVMVDKQENCCQK